METKIHAISAGVILLTLQIFLALNPLQAQTQSQEINTINTAISTLRINHDARTGGIADIGVAGHTAIGDFHLNVAKLAFLSAATVGFDATNYAFNTSRSHVFIRAVGGVRVNSKHFVSGAFRYQGFGYGEAIHSNGAGDFELITADLGWSYQLSPKFSTGIAARYLHSDLRFTPGALSIPLLPSNSFAADLGVYYRSSRRMEGRENIFSAGLAITNVGPKVNYTGGGRGNNIPTNLGLGLNFTIVAEKKHALSSSLEFNKLLVPTPDTTDLDQNGLFDYSEKSVVAGMFSSFGDAPGGFSEEMKEIIVSLGLEYTYNKFISLRGGLFMESDTKGDRNYMSLGTGGKLGKYELNLSYAFSTNGYSTKFYRAGLAYDFGT